MIPDASNLRDRYRRAICVRISPHDERWTRISVRTDRAQSALTHVFCTTIEAIWLHLNIALRHLCVAQNFCRHSGWEATAKNEHSPADHRDRTRHTRDPEDPP